MNILNKLGKELLVFDGAMGTMLQQYDITQNDCVDMITLTNPEIISDIHNQYLSAGADVIQTNTFGANICKLERFNLSDHMKKINQTAAQLAKKAAAGQAFVAGDIGPTGKMIAPLGDLLPIDAYNAFYKQARELAIGGVDFILIETMSDIREARLAYLAARDATQLPVIVSFTFEKNRTLMGNSASTIALLFSVLGAAGIGANCSGGPEQLLPVAKQYASATHIPVLAQPNAGLPVMKNGKVAFPLDSQSFYEKMEPIASIADAIGGCCGTTPDHIRQLKKYSRKLKGPREKAALQLCTTRKNFDLSCVQNAEEFKLSDPYLIENALDSESEAIIIDLNGSLSQIQSKVGQITTMLPKAVIFKSSSYESLYAALFEYSGIAAMICSDSSVDLSPLSHKYGAISL